MKYIRLYEAMHPQDLTMIQLALTKEDVEYRTLYENTLQVANVYALGNNGAIIEVAEKDHNKAKGILRELGIELDYHVAADRFLFIHKFDEKTKKLPLLGKMDLGYRFLSLVLLSVSVISTIIFLNVVRISPNELIGHSWCVDEIIHKGKRIQSNTTTGPYSLGMRIKCKEDVSFISANVIRLPGFGTYKVRGRLDFKTDHIFTISDLDGFKEIYEGEYLIRTNWSGTMEFYSPNTTIVISRKF